MVARERRDDTFDNTPTQPRQERGRFLFLHEKTVTFNPFAFSIEGANHPNEDAFFVGKTPVFAVADGVTRTKLPDGSYPDPSGAALAAEVFVREAGQHLEQQYGNPNVQVVADAMMVGNAAIAKLNADFQIPQRLDFIVNDYFNCCGAIGRISGEHFQYAHIGDCQIAIFNKFDQLTLLTKNTVSELEAYREGRSYPSIEDRLIDWRKILRNHPWARHLTYGTLTGEAAAMNYVRDGTKIISSGDLITLFTDGLAQIIMLSEFRKLLRWCPTKEGIRQLIDKVISTHAVAPNVDDKTIISIVIP